MSTAISVCHGEFGRAALFLVDKSLTTHAHREGHMLFYVEGGACSMTVYDQTHDLDSVKCAAISPLEPHSFNFLTSEASLLLILYIKPIWFLQNTRSTNYSLQFGDACVTRTSSINDLVKRITALLLQSEHPDNADALLLSLTEQCFEQSWNQSALDNLAQDNGTKFSDYRIRRSLRMMQQNNSVDVELEEIARLVGLSRPHFFKLFKKQLGITPNVYLNTLRTERAIDELINTEKSVTDIAYDLGYSSQASFTRFFLSNVGIAPSEYRRVADR